MTTTSTNASVYICNASCVVTKWQLLLLNISNSDLYFCKQYKAPGAMLQAVLMLSEYYFYCNTN